MKFARCIRAHGVPNFPDPRFSATRGIGIPGVPDNNPNAPAFRHAEPVCGNP